MYGTNKTMPHDSIPLDHTYHMPSVTRQHAKEDEVIKECFPMYIYTSLIINSLVSSPKTQKINIE